MPVDRGHLRIGFTYTVIAVPFVVSGVVVCLMLTGFPVRVSCLCGGSYRCGARLHAPHRDRLLRWSHRGVVGVGARVDRRDDVRPRHALASASSHAATVSTLLLLVAALGHNILVWREFPVFRILYMKGSFEARPLYEKWNSCSRVRVRGSQKTKSHPKAGG